VSLYLSKIRIMLSGAQAVRACQRLSNVSHHSPVVFDCSLLKNKWLRSGHWTPQHLASLTSTLHVKRSSNKHFMYIEGGRKDLLHDEGENTAIIEMDTGMFFDKCSQQTQGGPEFHYFTGRVKDCFPTIMPSDWDTYIVDQFEGVSNSDHLGYLSVWLGGVGSTTQSHYDIANNCFLQLFGSKRIRVWHPSTHTQMHPFPDAHPRARKSRLDIDMIQGLDAPMLDVLLKPGDALYIPAFYFHHVEVVPCDSDPSISLNIFSQSKLSREFGSLLSIPSPKMNDKQQYVRDVLYMAKNMGISKSALCDIHRSRYQPVPPTLTPSSLDHVKQGNELEEMSLSFKPSLAIKRYVEGFCRVTNEYGHEDDTYVRAVRDICFAHLMELIALRNFGATEVGRALECVDQSIHCS
jgi:hypothetical protein